MKDLTPDPTNARAHNPRNVGMIVDALHDVGAARSIVVDEGGRVLAGNATIEAAAEAGIERVLTVDADGETLVAVRRSGLTEEQKKRLAYYDNRTAELADWDASQVLADIEDGLNLDGLFSDAELSAIVGSLSVPDFDGDDTALDRYDVPDALFPSDNEWGIPTLDSALQANYVHLPVSLWGAVARKKRMPGTWLFYTDDSRFEALWHDPSEVINTNCKAAVEPNFTVGPQTPKAVALWQIYRKRWLARWWQSYGVKVFVDINIDVEAFGDIALLGVPDGWLAYCTRGYSDRMQFIEMEYEIARQHAGQELLFLVYGGGAAVQELAKGKGWVWISEHMDQKLGGVVQDG